MKRYVADILEEQGPFPGIDTVHGVTYDGRQVWLASGDRSTRSTRPAAPPCARSRCPRTPDRVRWQASVPDRRTPDPSHRSADRPGARLDSRPGQRWRFGTRLGRSSLWVGQYRDRKIHQIDPHTGAVLRTIQSNRFVTGVTWVEGELWHATWENDRSELLHLDPHTGEVLESVEMPGATKISGLETDGPDRFFCGGARGGQIRAVRRPRRASAASRGSERAFEPNDR